MSPVLLSVILRERERMYTDARYILTRDGMEGSGMNPEWTIIIFLIVLSILLGVLLLAFHVSVL